MAGLDAVFGGESIACLDFNITCAFRLELYEMEKDKTRAKLIAYEVSKMFGSGDEGGIDDVDVSGAEVW